jgi:hypothetical protein
MNNESSFSQSELPMVTPVKQLQERKEEMTKIPSPKTPTLEDIGISQTAMQALQLSAEMKPIIITKGLEEEVEKPLFSEHEETPVKLASETLRFTSISDKPSPIPSSIVTTLSTNVSLQTPKSIKFVTKEGSVTDSFNIS